jgi:hypothetical protein
MQKLCKKCLTEKDIDEFYRHPRMGDGHLNKCKECTKADVREQRAANVEYYRNYDRVRLEWRTTSRPANDNGKRSEYGRRWYEKNKEKKRANVELRRAIVTGIVVKPISCSACGAVGCPIEGHHDDYSKPLSVRWLCTKCHGETRRKPRVQMRTPKRRGYPGPMVATRAAIEAARKTTP